MRKSTIHGALSRLSEALGKCFTSKKAETLSGKKKTTLKQRKLLIDPLEAREMLSLTVGMAEELAINEVDVRTAGSYGQYSVSVSTSGTDSQAQGKDGDLVVTWTQDEPIWVRDDSGERVVDRNGYFVAYTDAKGSALTEQNVYAKYFTDETQRLFLPTEFINGGGSVSASGQVGNFSLLYGGNEVQRLSFFQLATNAYTPISGEIRIGGFDVNGDGSTDWKTITFNESLGPIWNAANFQKELRSMGGYFSDVLVTPVNAQEFDIEFCNDYWQHNELPELKIDWTNNNSILNGSLASAIVSTQREPMKITLTEQKYDKFSGMMVAEDVGISAYKDNAEYTAAMIELAFLMSSEADNPEVMAAINYYAFTNGSLLTSGYYDDSHIVGISNAGIQLGTNITYTSDVIFQALHTQDLYTQEVRVTPVYGLTDEAGNSLDGLVFDITFVNDAGKINHPELKVLSARDFGNTKQYVEMDNGKPTFRYDPQTASGSMDPIVTQKETSSAFRVNEAETFNSATKQGVANQHASSVTVDADGEFVIAWQSDTRDATDPYNLADIYARRFTTQAIVDINLFGVAGTVYANKKVDDVLFKSDVSYDPNLYTADTAEKDYVQGVRSLGGQFRVNEVTASRQMNPSISCDLEGNFLVTWETAAQDMSYFAGIRGRWYDKDGRPMSQEFAVTVDATFNPGSSLVAMSPQGQVVVCFNSGNRVEKRVFAKFATVPHTVDNASFSGNLSTWFPSVAFDDNERYVIAWTELISTPLPNAGALRTYDVFAKMYQLEEAGEIVVREQFRVNSTDVAGYLNAYVDQMITDTYPSSWFGDQFKPSVTIDADGDIAILFEGRAPDMGTGFVIHKSDFAEIFAKPQNSDLQKYYEYFFNYPVSTSTEGYTYTPYAAYADDPDTFLRNFISQAKQQGATLTEQARLNAILESVVRNFRGAGNDIQMSRFDADAGMSTGALATDSVVNNARDGYNSRCYIEINSLNLMSGSLTLRVWGEFGGYSDITVGLAMYGNIPQSPATGFDYLNTYATANNLQEALNAALTLTATRTWDSVTQQLVNNDLDREQPLAAIVNILTPSQVAAWDGTPWAVPISFNSTHIFEIIFVGGAHDTSVQMVSRGSGDTTGGTATVRQMKSDGTGLEDKSQAAINIYNYWNMVYGYAGTEQTNAAGTATREGSLVASWTDNIQYSNGMLSSSNMLRYRTFTESTDTAGPLVTGMTLPSGQSVANGELISYGLRNLVVNFNEDLVSSLSADGKFDINNPDNWVLMKNGVVVDNAIASIDFGMSESKTHVTMNSSQSAIDGTLMHGSNKWEAVLTFTEILTDGAYELVAKSNISDKAGNTLNRRGQTAYGADTSMTFSVIAADGVQYFDNGGVIPPTPVQEENRVNPADLTQYQFTRWVNKFGVATGNTTYPTDSASNPDSIASDTRGNFVIVWTHTPENASLPKSDYGIWAEYHDVQNGNTVVFQVAKAVTGRQANVSMDNSGNIVVVWSQGGVGTEDIYFNYFRYNSATNTAESILADANEKVLGRRVHTDATGNQQNPSVSIDASGNFVVAWESNIGVNTGQGWDVYAQRFQVAAKNAIIPIGGADETQEIVFYGKPKSGNLILWIPVYESGNFVMKRLDLAVSSNLSTMAEELRAKLFNVNGNFRFTNDDLLISVGGDRITLQFKGLTYGNQILPEILADTSQMTMADYDAPSGTRTILSVPKQKGSGGEFLLSGDDNGKEQAGDQRYPKVALTAMGALVATWTGVALTPGDTDIFIRLYGANSIVAIGRPFSANNMDDNWLGDVSTSNYNDGTGMQTWSDVAVDMSGNFVVTWTSTDITRSISDGIYARRFQADGLALSDVFMVSSTGGTNIGYSNIAMTSTGDFVITWESYQDRSITNGVSAITPDSYGIYAKQFVNSAILGLTSTQWTPTNRYVPAYGTVGVNGEVSGEFRVNRTLVKDQRGAAVAISNRGDFIVAWNTIYEQTENGVKNLYSDGLFYRQYPSAQSVGAPFVTKATASRLGAGALEYPLNALAPFSGNPTEITLYFSDVMRGDSTVRSVLTRSNWTLTRNGVAVPVDTILQFLSEDGNGIDSNGTMSVKLVINEALINGDYVLTLSDRVWNMDGVALDGDYNGVAGGIYSLNFTVNGTYTGSDSDVDLGIPGVVSGDKQGNANAGDQYTRGAADVDSSPTPRSVASDADGNYITVWYDAATNKIMGRKYREDGTLDTGEFVIVEGNGSTLKQPSVAMDPDGDAVVTWAQSNGGVNGFDVYYLYLIEINGQILAKKTDGSVDAPSKVSGNRVNVEQARDQQNPRAAMDTQGSFVITWESRDMADDGELNWNIHGQRYSPNGNVLGVQYEIQSIDFVGLPSSGSFVFSIVNGGIKYTFSASISSSMQQTVANIKSALAAQGFNVDENDVKCEIKIVFNGGEQIQFHFVGARFTATDMATLHIENYTINDTYKVGKRVVSNTLLEWESGVFVVNDTKVGDQRFPDVAMNLAGEFVITWTSWDIDVIAKTTDANIYAKTYSPSSLLWDTLTDMKVADGTTTQPYVIWPEPDTDTDRIVGTGQGLDGVVQIYVFDSKTGSAWSGTGSLLESGMHILTAAHVVSDSYGNVVLPEDVYVYFDLPQGRVEYRVVEVDVYPGYDGDYVNKVDLAVLRLEAVAPVNANRYEIYRGTEEIGQIMLGAGYGISGQVRADGTMDYSDPGKYWFQNTYERYGTNAASTLSYDFDYVGTNAVYDLFGDMYGIHDTGLGTEWEGRAAPGDSGGPSFINANGRTQIAGVVSYGNTALTYYTYGVDVRVSFYADWITRQMVMGGSGEMIVNDTLVGDQMYSSVGIDALGNFAITWTSTYTEYEITPADPLDPTSVPVMGVVDIPAVLAKRYDSSSFAVAPEFFVSDTTTYGQMYSQITMSPKGDFTIAWEGEFDDGNGLPERRIAAQRYVNMTDGYYVDYYLGQYVSNTMLPHYGALGANGSVGVNFFVSESYTDKTGKVYYAEDKPYGVSLSSNSEGEAIFVWTDSGNGLDVYQRRASTKDVAAPFIADMIAVYKDGNANTLQQIVDNTVFKNAPNYLVLTLSEDVVKSGLNGIEYAANWAIMVSTGMGGETAVRGAITKIEYLGRNGAKNLLGYESGKYEVIVYIDPSALPEGLYTLVLKDTIKDKAGNFLDGDKNGRSGSSLTMDFYVTEYDNADYDWNKDTADEAYAYRYTVLQSTKPAIASAADGAFVIASVGNVYGSTAIVLQRYDKYGQMDGMHFTANRSVYGALYSVGNPDVAMDSSGNIVVVWDGGSDATSAGIYAKIYDINGLERVAEFRVNSSLSGGVFSNPKVTLLDDGTVFVTYLAYNQAAKGYSVYGRYFGLDGMPQTVNGTNVEFVIGTAPSQYNIMGHDMAGAIVNGVRHFAVTWQARSTGTSTQEIYSSVLKLDAANKMTKLSDSVQINTFTANDQFDPAITLSGETGVFVISWTSQKQDGADMGVYAKAFRVNGNTVVAVAVDGSTGDFQLNTTAKYSQQYSDVGLARDGSRLVATWTSYGQEDPHYDVLGTTGQLVDNGIVARTFAYDKAKGAFVSETLLDADNRVIVEQNINRYLHGNQQESVVAVDQNGDFRMAWSNYWGSYDQMALLTGVADTMYRVFQVNRSDFPIRTFVGSGARTEQQQQITAMTTQAGISASNSGGAYAAMTTTAVANLPTLTQIKGTAGNDTFRFVADSVSTANGSFKVYLNGSLITTIPANSLGIEFDGLGGINTVIFEGSDAAESVTVDAVTRIARMFAYGYDVTAKNVTNFTVYGNGGNDSISIKDSAGNDTVNMNADTYGVTVKLANGSVFTANGFETVAVTSGGGNDSAVMYDSAGDDKFVMSDTTAKAVGYGFLHTLNGYSQVKAFSSGGNDTASLSGTNGVEEFITSENVSMFIGAGFSQQVQGFKSVSVNGGGGADRAKVTSNYGNSLFVSDPIVSSMYYKDGSSVSMRGFADQTVTANSAGDRAVLSAGSKANFVGNLNTATLTSSGTSSSIAQTLNGFSNVTVYGQRGTQSLAMLDLTMSDDRLIGGNANANGISFTVDESTTSLYNLIAFDKVTATKKDSVKGKLTLDGSADYLFATGAWE